ELASPLIFVIRSQSRQLVVVAAFYAFHVITFGVLGLLFLPHLVALAAFLPLENLPGQLRAARWGSHPNRRNAPVSSRRSNMSPENSANPAVSDVSRDRSAGNYVDLKEPGLSDGGTVCGTMLRVRSAERFRRPLPGHLRASASRWRACSFSNPSAVRSPGSARWIQPEYRMSGKFSRDRVVGRARAGVEIMAGHSDVIY